LSALVERRALLKASGALIITFALEPLFGRAAQTKATKPVGLDSVDSYLAVDSDGLVTVYSGKVDLGTGVRTALTQIVAEELDVPFASVTLIQGDTELTPDQGVTYGSLSIQNGGVQLRQAAATARQTLLKIAAARMKVAPETLTIDSGTVIGADQQRLPLQALIGNQSSVIHARYLEVLHKREGDRSIHVYAGLQGTWHVSRTSHPARRDERETH